MTNDLQARRVEAAAKYIQDRYIDLEYHFAEDIAKGALAAADAVTARHDSELRDVDKQKLLDALMRAEREFSSWTFSDPVQGKLLKTLRTVIAKHQPTAAKEAQ